MRKKALKPVRLRKKRSIKLGSVILLSISIVLCESVLYILCTVTILNLWLTLKEKLHGVIQNKWIKLGEMNIDSNFKGCHGTHCWSRGNLSLQWYFKGSPESLGIIKGTLNTHTFAHKQSVVYTD